MLVIMVTSTLPSTSSERNTVIHHVRTIMAVHHFTLLVAMVTSTLPSTSSERNTVIHHVRTIMAGHHFTMLVTSTLPSTSSERNTVIHHVRTIMARTPLHYACRYGNLNIAQYLIREEHCNPSCENNSMAVHTTLHMLVAMVTSTLPSTSSERNTVIHHVRTIMAIHHFTMLV